MRAVTQNSDIFGSTCGSLRKSMHTIRHTNPLSPAYQNPGAYRNTDGSKTNNPYANDTSADPFKSLKLTVIDGASRPSAAEAVKDSRSHKASADVASQGSATASFRHTAPAVSCGNAIVGGSATTKAQKLD